LADPKPSRTQLPDEPEIDLIELLGWWSDLNTAKDESEDHSQSYYEQLFLNKAVMNPVESIFELNGDGTALAIEDSGSVIAISEYNTQISAALGLSSADLNYLIELLDNDELTLSSLSQLHRLTSASNVFDVQPKDLKYLFSLVPDDPFRPTNPEGAVYFAEKVRLIKSGNLDEKELAYIFMHDFNESDKMSLSEEKIGQSLQGIQENLQTIIAENNYDSDPMGEVTATKLALIVDEETYTALIAIITEQSSLAIDEQEQIIEDSLGFLDPTDAKTSLLSIDENLTQEARIQGRYNYLFEPLLNHIISIQSAESVAQSVADEFDLDLDTALLLVSELSHSVHDSSKFALDEFLDETFVNYEYEGEEAISYDLFPAQYDSWLLLHKVSMIIAACDLTNDELIWVYENANAIDWLDLDLLPVAYTADGSGRFLQWLKMAAMCSFNSTYRTEDSNTLSLLDMAINGSAYEVTPTLDDFSTAYQEFTDWELSDIQFLLEGSAYNLTLDQLSDGQALIQMEACLQLVKSVGTTAETLWSWTAGDLDENLAASIRQTVKSHYGNDQWLALAPSLRDPLRRQQRNALSAYLIGQAGYDDEMDLFDHYLIDTEMQACMLTSRIKVHPATAYVMV